MLQPRASYLFQKYFNKSASEEEKLELFQLLHHQLDDQTVQSLLETAYNDFEPMSSPFPEGSREKMLAAIRQSIDLPLKVTSNKRRKWIRFAAAAAIFAVTFTGYWFWKENDQQHSTQPPAPVIAVVPGKQAATLTLADGRIIDLDAAENGQLASESGVNIRKSENGEVVYETTAKSNVNQAVQFNILSTVRGEQYQVKLPDGTKVWLNSASSLRYPVAFSTSERKVELEGEAYFEVAKSSSPFIVHTHQHNIEVLGTHFNVNNYPGEAAGKTTLLEGSVKIQPMGRKLSPGEQFIIRKGQYKVINVHAEDAIAWKNGYFMFNNEELEEIMMRIARWYDVEINYARLPQRKITFFGSVSRFSEIGEVLKRLEMTGEVTFNLKGRILTVTAK